MLSAGRVIVVTAVMAVTAITGCTGEDSDDLPGGNCVEGKCDGYGGAELLSELSTTVINDDALPSSFTAIGSNKALFFTANKRGLWVTDGTAAGTKLVRDLEPSHDYGESPEIVAFEGKGYWEIHGSIWRSDGTATGTAMLIDFGLAASNSISPLAVVNGSLLFGAAKNLYISDGTPAGTQVLAPLDARGDFEVVGDRAYFSCVRADVGQELCVSDGTATGTRLVKDIKAGTPGTDPTMLGTVGGKTLFSIAMGDLGQRALWVTDGTDAGTIELLPDGSQSDAVGRYEKGVVFGSHLYFACNTPATGYELCKSNGTVAGTVALDLVPGPGIETQSSSPRSFAVLGNRIFFAARSATLGRELWSSDGTLAGTSVLVDLRTFPGSKDGLGLTELLKVGDQILFASEGNGNQVELWATDGTATGTKQISNILAEGVVQRYPLGLHDARVFGDKLLFSADDGMHGVEPWITDGTATGTKLILDLVPEITKARAVEAKTFRNGTYLGVEDGDAMIVWRTDGTSDGTAPLHTMHRQATPGFTAVGSTLYYRDWSALWKTDGTPTGSVKVRDMPGNIHEMVPFGNVLAFTGTTPNSSLGFWLSDGTAGGTVVTNLLNAEHLAAANGRLWLTALIGSGGNELFTSDGTAAGTKPVADLYPGNEDGEPAGFIAFDGKTLFSATDATAGRELWTTDGTAAGTQRLVDIAPGAKGSMPSGMTVWNNMVVMWASPTTSGTELWRTDGTAAGTARIKAVRYAGTGALVPWNGHLFFAATDDKGTELWRTDGTEAGTVRVADIYDGSPSSRPAELVLAGPDGPLYFVAEEPTGGRELWKLASATGTPMRAADLLAGPRSSNPSRLQTRGSALLFVANGGRGEALFRLGDAPDVMAPTVSCPDDMTVKTASDVGAQVTFATPSATDNDGTPTIETTPASGDMFPVGTTTVTVTATDAASNTASCTFDIIVTLSDTGGGSGSGSGSGGGGPDPDPGVDPDGGGCSTSGGHSSSGALLLIALAGFARRRRR